MSSDWFDEIFGFKKIEIPPLLKECIDKNKDKLSDANDFKETLKNSVIFCEVDD